MHKLRSLLVAIIAMLILGLGNQSCKYYYRDLILQNDTSVNSWVVENSRKTSTTNYKVRIGDWVNLQVYTNKGEMLVDPNSELPRQLGGGSGNMQGSASGLSGGSSAESANSANMGALLVAEDGTANLPLIGRVKVSDLTYRQADSLLARLYSKYYEDPFIIFRVTNRRAIVYNSIAADGGGGSAIGKVVFLTNENTSLMEVLALSGGIGFLSSIEKVRIIRGDLRNPSMQVVNLKRLETLAKADLRIEPNDIIYIEPGRIGAIAALRDLAPFLGIFVALLSLILTSYAILRR